MTSLRRERAGCTASSFRALRAARKPVASFVLATYASALASPAVAWAARDEASPIVDVAPALRAPSSPADAASPAAGAPASAANGNAAAAFDASRLERARDALREVESQAARATPTDTMSLTFGGDKSGLSAGAVSLPQGPGKVQGLGESFSAQLSTGIATFSVPIAVPTGRGPTVSLALAYSSAGRHGNAGVGWDLSTPYIARQTDRGTPSYAEQPAGG